MLGKVILLSAIAGVLGTGVGGLAGVLLSRRDSKLLTSRMFQGSAGIMLGLVFFDLIPEALELASVSVVILGFAIGCLFVFWIGEAVEEKMKKVALGKAERNYSMMTTAIVLLISVLLHNLPEGLVIGSSSLVSSGILTTVLIAVHNVPEGIAMALPFVRGGEKGSRAALLCFAAGAPMVLGAVLGYFLGGISPFVIALFFSIAAGAMLAAVFAEMIPRAHEITGESDTVGTVLLLAGVAVALILVTIM